MVRDLLTSTCETHTNPGILEILMYETPKLEKFGSFRELTLNRYPSTNTKRVIGDDLIPGIGMDCDGNAPVGDPTACIRS